MSKPLTIEELKALETGDWVWVVENGIGKYWEFEYSYSHNNEDIGAFLGTYHDGKIFNYSDYGTKWLAYKNKEFAETKGEWVELPCKIGDTVYGVWFTSCQDRNETDKKRKREIFNECMKHNGQCEQCKYRIPAIEKFVCTHIQLSEQPLIVGARCENYEFHNVFTDKSQAEVRLKELRGGK